MRMRGGSCRAKRRGPLRLREASAASVTNTKNKIEVEHRQQEMDANRQLRNTSHQAQGSKQPTGIMSPQHFNNPIILGIDHGRTKRSASASGALNGIDVVIKSSLSDIEQAGDKVKYKKSQMKITKIVITVRKSEKCSCLGQCRKYSRVSREVPSPGQRIPRIQWNKEVPDERRRNESVGHLFEKIHSNQRSIDIVSAAWPSQAC